MISLTASTTRSEKIEINLISSIYGKKTDSIQKWIDDGLLLYRNDMENSKAALTVRLQLPSAVTTSTNNVLLMSRIVNKTQNENGKQKL